MRQFNKLMASIMAAALLISTAFIGQPITAKAAAPIVTASQAAISIENGKSAAVTITVQNYTGNAFNVEYMLSDPSVAIINKTIDFTTRTATLNITTLKKGATGVVVYLSDNLSSYTTFVISSYEKVEEKKQEEEKKEDSHDSEKVTIDGYKIRSDSHVYGDHGESGKIKTLDVVEVDDNKKLITAYVQIRKTGSADEKAYFKANFYDRSDRLLSTKYIYQPNLVKDSYYYLWWEIPDKTYKIRFEK